MIAGFTFVQLAILVIVVAAICMIVWIILKAMGVVLPQWFINVLLVLVAAVVGVFAVKLIASMF